MNEIKANEIEAERDRLRRGLPNNYEIKRLGDTGFFQMLKTEIERRKE